MIFKKKEKKYDLIGKIFVFTIFMVIISGLASFFFSFMSIVLYVSGIALVISAIVKVFQKVFLNS